MAADTHKLKSDSCAHPHALLVDVSSLVFWALIIIVVVIIGNAEVACSVKFMTRSACLSSSFKHQIAGEQEQF